MISVPPLAASTRSDRDPRSLVGYAVLAPSSHNSQPWRFLVDGNTILLCADRVRALPVVDPFDRELIISCGAALLNLRVALDHAGLAHTIGTFPSEVDPDLLAQVRICDDGYSDAALGTLFDAIPARVRTRAPFESGPVSEAIQHALIEAGIAEGADQAVSTPHGRAPLRAAAGIDCIATPAIAVELCQASVRGSGSRRPAGIRADRLEQGFASRKFPPPTGTNSAQGQSDSSGFGRKMV